MHIVVELRLNFVLEKRLIYLFSSIVYLFSVISVFLARTLSSFNDNSFDDFNFFFLSLSLCLKKKNDKFSTIFINLNNCFEIFSLFLLYIIIKFYYTNMHLSKNILFRYEKYILNASILLFYFAEIDWETKKFFPHFGNIALLISLKRFPIEWWRWFWENASKK